MLIALEKLLLGLWLLPLALGLAVGLRTGGDEGRVMLFVTGIVAVVYVVVLAAMLHHACRRLHRAETVPARAAGPHVTAGEVTAGAPGRSGAPALDLPLFLVVPAAVGIVVQEGVWTVVVITGLLVTVLSLAAHVHARGADPGPPVPGRTRGRPGTAPPPPGVTGAAPRTGPAWCRPERIRTAARTWPSARNRRRRRGRRR